MNELMISHQKNYMPTQQEFHQLLEVSKVLATCPYYLKLGAGGVLSIWLTAKEMNLPPMMCLNGGMYTFSGLVSLSAQLMNMMIINAGHRIDVVELNEKRCELLFVRCDRREGEGKTFRYDYTIVQAHNAGLLRKDNWKNNPRDMLFSRALSGGARKFMPDVLMNAYVHGELEDDGHIQPSMPAIEPQATSVRVAPSEPMTINVEAQQTQHTEPTEKKKPKLEPEVQIMKFLFDKGIIAAKDGSHSFVSEQAPIIDEYIRETSVKAEMDYNEIVSAAIRHEELFNKRFNEWKGKRKEPKPQLLKAEASEV